MSKKIHEKGTAVSSYLKSWFKTFSAGLTVFCLVTLIFLPFLSQTQTYQYLLIRQFTLAMIFSIFAASWDFLAGIAGQVNFGHAMFLGIGGYACAYFIKYQYVSIWISIVIGAIAAIIAGFFIGIACLRVKGPYLALLTLCLNLILIKLFIMGSLEPIFFGSEGISGLPKISDNPMEEYFTLLIVMVVSLITLIGISKSKFGTILRSIRDDETGASASGINTNKYKVLAFMISGLFAGIAGAFYALYVAGVNPTGNFGQVNSFFAIIMASLGGLGTISGATLGAFFFILTEFAIYRADLNLYIDVYVLFAIILILLVRFAQRGTLKPLIERLRSVWDLIAGK